MSKTITDKGLFNGTCNLSSCTSGNPATWYNHGSLEYYCKGCAMRLNRDEFNKREADRLWGHDLCTEGEHNSGESPESFVRESAASLTKDVFQKLKLGSHLVGINKIGKGHLVVTEVNKKKEYHISLSDMENLRIVHNNGYLTVFGKRNKNINVNHIFLLFYHKIDKKGEVIEADTSNGFL